MPIPRAQSESRNLSFAVAGLQVDMNTDQSEYLESIVDRAGARVVIHDSTEMPFPDETGIFVAPGLSTSVGLRKVISFL